MPAHLLNTMDLDLDETTVTQFLRLVFYWWQFQVEADHCTSIRKPDISL